MDPPNRYSVRLEEDESGWRVAIIDPSGGRAAERAWAHEPEAQVYASTIRQHIYWLSEERFRRYYRLPDPPEV